MTTTQPIRATYSPRPSRRTYRRRITTILLLPPLAAASLGLTGAIAAGIYQGITRPAPAHQIDSDALVRDARAYCLAHHTPAARWEGCMTDLLVQGINETQPADALAP